MNNLSVPQKICSYILKTVTVLSALIGSFLSYYAGRLSFMGGSRVFMFFTIQSNIAIAVICAIGCVMMLRGREAGKVWPVIKFVGTISITLTGVVFGFVLAPTLGSHAWNIQNTLTHLVVPVAAVIDFFVVSTAFEIKKRNDFFVIVPPILYAVYAGIGYVRGWQFIEGINYPYFFLNWGSPAGAFGFSNELPFMGTAWWIVALLFFLLAIGYIYLLIADGIKRIGKKAA
ncbi:MAG: Pr6Pr family membrane protein [Lachnospiraceae bacterium]|nr:Pr6Pr family membrane protein [Lachnospiraceae bacterium]